jgi:Ferritin-like domain
MKSKYVGISHRSSRRSVLKGSIVGAAGIAGVAGLVGAGIVISEQGQHGDAHAAYGQDPSSYSYKYGAPDSIQTILNIAATAEQLGVTFYALALKNADELELGKTARADFRAAKVEEQIHLKFLLANGAQPLTGKFSFPYGGNTFMDFDRFISVQQLLETLFVAAYIAAAKEFAMLGRPDLVQAAMQIGTIESEHRAVGRAIAGLQPANNRAFSPALLKKVGDAPNVLKQKGFLSPTYGNSFYFPNDSMDYTGVEMYSPSDQSWS